MKDENDTIYCAYWVFKNGGGYWVKIEINLKSIVKQTIIRYNFL